MQIIGKNAAKLDNFQQLRGRIKYPKITSDNEAWSMFALEGESNSSSKLEFYACNLEPIVFNSNLLELIEKGRIVVELEVEFKGYTYTNPKPIYHVHALKTAVQVEGIVVKEQEKDLPF